MSDQYVSLEEFELQVEALRKFIREEAAAEATRHDTRWGLARLHLRAWQLEGRVRILEKAVLRGALLLMALILAWLALETFAG